MCTEFSKSKDQKTLETVLGKILDKYREFSIQVTTLSVDGELDFLNSYCKRNGIHLNIKAKGQSVNLCEATIKILKTKVYRMMIFHKNNQYWNYVEPAVTAINMSFVPSLGNLQPYECVKYGPEIANDVISQRLHLNHKDIPRALTLKEQREELKKLKSKFKLGSFVFLNYQGKDSGNFLFKQSTTVKVKLLSTLESIFTKKCSH